MLQPHANDGLSRFVCLYWCQLDPYGLFDLYTGSEFLPESRFGTGKWGCEALWS